MPVVPRREVVVEQGQARTDALELLALMVVFAQPAGGRLAARTPPAVRRGGSDVGTLPDVPTASAERRHEDQDAENTCHGSAGVHVDET